MNNKKINQKNNRLYYNNRLTNVKKKMINYCYKKTKWKIIKQ